MCTVIYLPGKNGALFSSNRDENPNRIPAAKPTIKTGKERTLLYPSDGAAGGTWIGINNAGDLLILLNGGFDNHIKKDSYRKSRGLIVKEILDCTNPIVKWNNTSLDYIEPFTIIAYLKTSLHQLVWTGSVKMHLRPNPNEAHIWSSSTLYNAEVKKIREQWFYKFIGENHDAGNEELLYFLKNNATNDIENNFVMNRGGKVKTCSISIVAIEEKKGRFDYYDLLDNTIDSTDFYFDMQKKNDASEAGIITHPTLAVR